jgi:hypothetical protein
MEGKIIIGLMFFFFSITSQAQKNKFIPPDWKQQTYSFALPELQIDSIFMKNLNVVLFDKNDRYMNSRISNPNNRWRHFLIHFEKTDSLNYRIVVSLWDIPAIGSTGFYEHNGFLYWFGGDISPNIILGKKSKRRFSYKEDMPGPYDPPFWTLIYNPQTGNIEVKENHYD